MFAKKIRKVSQILRKSLIADKKSYLWVENVIIFYWENVCFYKNIKSKFLIIIEFSENIIQIRWKHRKADCFADKNEDLIMSWRMSLTIYHSADKSEDLIMSQKTDSTMCCSADYCEHASC